MACGQISTQVIGKYPLIAIPQHALLPGSTPTTPDADTFCTRRRPRIRHTHTRSLWATDRDPRTALESEPRNPVTCLLPKTRFRMARHISRCFTRPPLSTSHG